MKTLITFVLSLCLLVLSGCATLPSGTYVVAGQSIDPQTVKRTLTSAAKFGTREGLRQDENSRAYFVSALAILDASISAEQYSPDNLAAALRTISIKELQDPRVADAIAAAVDLYAIHVGDAVAKKLDTTIYVKPMLEGLRDGIKAGLLQ